jgi:predicted O-methyltransferase YrrM
MRAYDYCEREKRLFAHKMRVIAALFDILTPGGDFYITTTGFCEDSVVEMYCTLALMFNHITVYNSISVLCSGFASAITKEDVMRISAGGGTMGPATHTPKVTQLAAYLHANLRHQTQLFELLLAKKEEEFLQGVFSQNISAFGSMKPEALEHFMVQYNISLVENLRRVVVDGKIEKTSSAINGAEGRTILAVLAKYNLRKCVEVGLAHGVSAFYILSNPDTTLVSIDPYQNSQWRGRGVDLIRSFGFSARHKLHELKSYEALPRILVGKGEGSFDFVFIDGFHTFDYTLVDFFYSNLLLRIGGVIMIDDALHHGVAKCVRYIDSNYKHFRKLASSPTVAVFLKLREDTRDWDFHAGF